MRVGFTILAALSLSGCYSMQGSERILNRDGRITQEVPANSIFASDFKNALEARMADPDIDEALVRAMLSSGFTHIYSYCDGYFDTMGVNQRKSRVFRDSIAPISAIITGVVALHSFENNPKGKENIVAALGIATVASSSLLDIYDEHMLFGSENIGAVETLTKSALSSHSSRVLEFDTVSFDAAIRHLLDNQAQCSPQQILLLTREAIREGRVAARVKDVPAAAAPAVVQPGAAGAAPPPAVAGQNNGANAAGNSGNDRVQVGIEN